MIGIGGVGGSGTRLIASMMEELGYYFGQDINVSKDNLLFTLLFKSQNILFATDEEIQRRWQLFFNSLKSDYILSNDDIKLLNSLSCEDRTLHNKEWLQDRVNNIVNIQKDRLVNNELLAYKEPNSHIVMERLFKIQKNMKFIYVYRNGLDMAFSDNQNQLKLWGKIVFNNYDLEINPRNSLKYWIYTHKRIMTMNTKHKDKVYMLNFDALCLNECEEIEKLLLFLDISCDLEKMSALKELISVPASIGRYEEHDISLFDGDDVEYCKEVMRSE